MIRDLKVANDAVIPIHPLLANPFDVLSQVPKSAQWFTMLDLKDAFFCIPVQPSPQYLFAFALGSSIHGIFQARGSR